MAANLIKIGVFTKDRFLFQKIRLEFLGKAEAKLLTPKSSTAGFEIILRDDDDTEFEGCTGIGMSRYEGTDISLPFKIGSLLPLLEKNGRAPLRLIESNKCVLLADKQIKLTDLEYDLLYAIMEKRGEYVSREELLSRIWQNKTDKGILNVYIHYLREKLEKGGERIIISSRNLGYKINEVFISEGEDA